MRTQDEELLEEGGDGGGLASLAEIAGSPESQPEDLNDELAVTAPRRFSSS